MSRPAPFEEPDKTVMRDRCATALDKAGYAEVSSLTDIPLPAGLALRGALKGDIQSVDGAGNRYCYFLRPKSVGVLPKWLANLAVASHSIPGVKVYIVTHNPSGEFVRSCRAVGAGVLALVDDDMFDHVLDYDELTPLTPDAVFSARLSSARRTMESRLDLKVRMLEGRLQSVNEMTVGMADNTAESYRSALTNQLRSWQEWGDSLSGRLDKAYAGRDASELSRIEADVKIDPLVDDPVDSLGSEA